MKIVRIHKKDLQICLSCGSDPDKLYYYASDDEEDGMCAECLVEDLVDNGHEVDC